MAATGISGSWCHACSLRALGGGQERAPTSPLSHSVPGPRPRHPRRRRPEGRTRLRLLTVPFFPDADLVDSTTLGKAQLELVSLGLPSVPCARPQSAKSRVLA